MGSRVWLEKEWREKEGEAEDEEGGGGGGRRRDVKRDGLGCRKNIWIFLHLGTVCV